MTRKPGLSPRFLLWFAGMLVLEAIVAWYLLG